MSKDVSYSKKGNSEILFFILVFLLLFYDNSAICGYPYAGAAKGKKRDSSILFFILIFLLLFYDNGA
ncbi:MAG: hypothetical protein GX066_02100 [Clostridiaceae bacterium]|nr:hypothetical protein [Clostridiaceae bacterium]